MCDYLLQFLDIGLDTHLFVNVYLDQDTAKGPFRFLSQAATCYYQLTEAIPLSSLLKKHNNGTYRPMITLLLFYAERQARKL